MPLRLLVTVGPDMGKEFSLATGKSCVLGRGDDCDLQLSDARVSRHHCRIQVEGGRAILKDLNSSWGTLVNGNKVETCALQPGDVLTLVETQLRFEVAADAAATTWGPGSETPPVEAKPASSEGGQPSQSAPAEGKTPRPSGGNEPKRSKPRHLESLLGKTIHRYEIQDILARAKTGIVFRARDTKRNRPVALKVLWPEISQNEDDVRRFVRAIKTMAEIRHPNLIRVYGAGKSGPFCWTACELLDADNLDDRIDKAGQDRRLPWKHALQIGLDIARGLQAAAGHNVVHRNITPKNILIDRKDGGAKLGDLMLAKALEGSRAEKITRPGETVGELPFLAPEQLSAPGAIDTRADIYSLGAVLYTALTGQPPITGRTLSETLRNIESVQPAPPTELNPAIPAEFEAIIMQMLAKNPHDRFASTGDVLAELEALARVHGVLGSSSNEVLKPPTVPEASAAPVSESSDWIPPLQVEEQSVSARLNRKKKKAKPDRKAGRRTQWMIAGSAGGVLILLLGILWAAGVFEGDAQRAPKPKTTAQNDDSAPEDKPGNLQKASISEENENAAGGSTESPFGDPVMEAVTEPMELPKLIETVEPSVARIDVTTLKGQGSGSGFVVDREGTLVTNYHVIAGADKATAVFADGKQVRVEGAWHTDPKRDIAILQLNTFGIDLTPLRLAGGLPPKGESVVAFGAPLGFDFTASQGIVSGVRRAAELERIGIDDHLGTWVQTTAPISRGNSGGPLVNRRGEVVAVNTMTFALGQNLNLAISATDVQSALTKRSGEPAPLSELTQQSLAAEFGLDEGSEIAPQKVTVNSKIIAEIKRLEAEGEKPLKTYAEKGEPLYSDQKKKWENQIPLAYKSQGQHDPRWDKHVEAMMQLRDREDRPALRDAAQAAVEAGCQDPAILMLCALAFLPESRALELADRAADGLADSNYGLCVQHKLRILHLIIQSQFPQQRDNLENMLDQIRREYLELLRAPNLAPVETRMIYGDARQTLGSLLKGQEIEFLKQLENEDGIDPWLKEMLTGLVHHKLGWRARGTGFANTVSEQQWKVFHAKMAQAQAHWLKAWQMQPGYPEAATELLQATMAREGVAGEDERFWFEQAVKAQFDYKPAYEAYLWAIRPRWGGSHDQMLAFGRECLATRRFDTDVPWQFHKAVQDVASELGDDGSNIYRRFGIADDYLQAIEGYRAETDAPEQTHLLDSQKACILLLAGRKDEARKLVDRLGNNLDERGFKSFNVNSSKLLKSLE